MSKCKMDKRCPLKLEDLPDSFCPLAVQRLKAIRTAGRELTEEEEAVLPGCTWAIDCQTANYCFFSYISSLLPDGPISEVEVAGLLNISADSVKKLEKTAILKVKDSKQFVDIKNLYSDGQIVEDKDDSFTIVE